MTKDPLKQLVKSSEWMDAYRAGVEYGVQKERQHPQILRFGVEIKLGKKRKVVVRKFPAFQEALDWAVWNYKNRIDYFKVIKLQELQKSANKI